MGDEKTYPKVEIQRAQMYGLYLGWIGLALGMTEDWDIEDVLKRVKEICCQLAALKEENERLRDIIDRLHPRVIKLARRDDPFVVVGSHEPYFEAVYNMIEAQESRQGTWTEEDRIIKATVLAAARAAAEEQPHDDL